MSKCKLDIDEPNLTTLSAVSKSDLRGGLEELRDKVVKDHHLSGWFNHPMPGFSAYFNKIWEWDFRPTGERSATRGGWRILAYVEDARGQEPILARPFVCWDKDDAPKGNQERFIAKALKKFLAGHFVRPEEETFQIRTDGERHYGMCLMCWNHFESGDREDIELIMSTHKSDCSGQPTD